MEFNHPDIEANIWVNLGEIPDNEIDDDGNGFVDDMQGWNFDGDRKKRRLAIQSPLLFSPPPLAFRPAGGFY
ncbi:MAG: hypothetical protein IH892_21290 [Planctomycetes bacterium]|nr:hypothetical protein [Planctomycetota bacterium]